VMSVPLMRLPEPTRQDLVEWDLHDRISVVNDYWLRTFGEMPNGPECAVIVMVLAALDEMSMSAS
jgi:hypothetical protein